MTPGEQLVALARNNILSTSKCGTSQGGPCLAEREPSGPAFAASMTCSDQRSSTNALGRCDVEALQIPLGGAVGVVEISTAKISQVIQLVILWTAQLQTSSNHWGASPKKRSRIRIESQYSSCLEMSRYRCSNQQSM